MHTDMDTDMQRIIPNTEHKEDQEMTQLICNLTAGSVVRKLPEVTDACVLGVRGKPSYQAPVWWVSTSTATTVSLVATKMAQLPEIYSWVYSGWLMLGVASGVFVEERQQLPICWVIAEGQWKVDCHHRGLPPSKETIGW